MKSAEIHTRAGKRRFIRSLTRSICKSACKAVKEMPAEWDGHELRELLAELFDFERGNVLKRSPYARDSYNARRVREYRSARAMMGRV